MNIRELLSPWLTDVLPDMTITGLQNDSRQVKPGDLFFAYPGAAADGRLFISQACSGGAVAILYESEHLLDPISSNIPCIPITKLSEKIASIASRFYGHPSKTLSITGVTGTNGKTTIAFQLAEAYELLGKKSAYIGTLGQGAVGALQSLANTTPDALCLQASLFHYQQQGIKEVCMEVSSHALCQHRVDDIDFTKAIFTNLSHEHLDYHQTMQAYAKAKASLFATPSLQFAIINHDDAYHEVMLKPMSAGCKILTYGLKEGADVRATDWQLSLSHSELEIASPWGRHRIRVNLLGQFNLYNTLAVFTSLLADGLPVNEVIEVMGQLKPSPGRMEVVTRKPYVIVDYAHTPDALENVLSTLLQLKRGRLGVVFGCGGDRDKGKRPMMGQIASQYADFVIITSDNPRSEDPLTIMDDIAEGLLPTTKAMKMVGRREAIKTAIDMAGEQDIILVAGKGHEDYQLIGKERLVFSDKDVVCELVKNS